MFGSYNTSDSFAIQLCVIHVADSLISILLRLKINVCFSLVCIQELVDRELEAFDLAKLTEYLSDMIFFDISRQISDENRMTMLWAC